MTSIIEILPNLWMGDYKDCGNLLSFNECSINTIINCCNMLPFTIDEIDRFDIDINIEMDVERIIHKIDSAIKFIQERLNKNRFILIYSFKNDQKASSILICYLMKYGQMEAKNAINAILSKKNNEFNPVLIYKTAIFKYYEHIMNIL